MSRDKAKSALEKLGLDAYEIHCLEQHVVEGVEISEIAHALNVSDTTVKGWLIAGRAKIVAAGGTLPPQEHFAPPERDTETMSNQELDQLEV